MKTVVCNKDYLQEIFNSPVFWVNLFLLNAFHYLEKYYETINRTSRKRNTDSFFPSEMDESFQEIAPFSKSNVPELNSVTHPNTGRVHIRTENHSQSTLGLYKDLDKAKRLLWRGNSVILIFFVHGKAHSCVKRCHWTAKNLTVNKSSSV